MDVDVTASGLVIGILVGLTGMGGGALTMPMLTLVFGVPPLAAVSTDLVASAVTKPVGALVHLRRRTVDLRLVGWLALSSLPGSLVGTLLARSWGSGRAQTVLKLITGVAVLLAGVLLFVQMYLDGARRSGARSAEVDVRPVRAVLLGAVAGLVVGTTSVGAGSIVIVSLLLIDRRLTSASLVGTDLVHAVPLVLVSACGHLLVGDVHFGLVLSLLIGSVPGVLVGALSSARMPDVAVRVLLGVMLGITGLMLLGSNVLVAALVSFAVAALSIGFRVFRAEGSEPAERPDARPEQALERRGE